MLVNGGGGEGGWASPERERGLFSLPARRGKRGKSSGEKVFLMGVGKRRNN